MAEGSPATTMSAAGLENKQVLIITFSCVFTFLTVLGAGSRVYGRLAVVRKLFVEDVFMLFATLAALGLSSVCIAGAYYGFGKHDSDLQTSTHFEVVRQTSLIAVYLWTGAALLIKLSFLLFYHRLDERKPMRWAVYVLMTLVVVQNLGMVFVTAFACMPGNALWPKTESVDGRCWSYSSIQWYINANGIAIAVLDSAILLTPLFMLHRLAIPKDKKYLVGGQFALAVLPIIAGGLRCFYTWHLISSSEPFYNLANPAICAQAEIHIAILCGSASSFNLLLKKCEWLPCHRPSTSIGSLPTMDGRWFDNKVEQITWHNWRLSTSELSSDMVMALHRNFGSKESVINANSPRDAPRIVLGKRRYTDVAGMPSRIRSMGVEKSEPPRSSNLQRSARTRAASAERLPAYQQRDSERCFSIPEKEVEDTRNHGLHFIIDKGYEGQTGVSAKAIVRFPSIASRMDRENASDRPAEEDARQKRSSVRLVSNEDNEDDPAEMA